MRSIPTPPRCSPRGSDTAPRRALRNPAALAVLAAVALLAASPADSAAAQSVLDRPPDMGGTWVGRPGTIYFNFIHRFESSGPPANKVVNYPTFLLAAALPANVLLGVHYATNSVLVPGFPNEWELLARFAPLASLARRPLDLAVTGAYNQPARSWDAELALARAIGPLRLLAAARGFSDFRDSGRSRAAAAGGVTLRLQRFVALAADVSSLLDRHAGEPVAWGAGLQLEIPYTPHSLSLQVSNTNTVTLQGASIGANRRAHFGFEFTIPLTLSRIFGGGAPRRGAATAAAADQAAAEVKLTNQLRFEPATVHVKVGQTVRWRNGSDLVHTVTLDPALAQKKDDVRLPAGAERFNSGNLEPGATFAHTFTVPGEYRYFCIPHEPAGMVARVIVDR